MTRAAGVSVPGRAAIRCGDAWGGAAVKTGALGIGLVYDGIMQDQQQFHLEVSRLPAERELRGVRSLGVFLMLFSLVWGGVPAATLILALAKNGFSPAMMPALVFPVVGIGLFLVGVNQFFLRGRVRIEEAAVLFERRSLFKRVEWTEPLARYAGLLYRTEYHSGGKNRPSYTLHIVELHHPEKARRVAICQSKSPEGMRQAWENSCRALKMPALEESGGTLLRREPTDLDKSVRDLAREHKLGLSFDPHQPPPEGIRLDIGRDELRLAIGVPALPLKVAIPWEIVSLLMIVLPFLVRAAPWFVAWVGLASLAVPVAWRTLSGRFRQVLSVSRAGVRVGWETPWGPASETVLPSAEIEQVELRRGSGGQSPTLHIITDRREISVGPFLKPAARDWLRNCILAVISAG